MLNQRDSRPFTQDTASAVWTVSHGLNRPVNVSVDVLIGTDYKRIVPKSVEAPDDNTLRITFSQPFAGKGRVF